MTNNTTNSQAPEILAKQVAEWRKEVARLNDLIAHAEGRDSQAASIDTPEFDDLLLTYWECRNQGESYATNERAELIAYIDAKLAQVEREAYSKGADDVQAHAEGIINRTVERAEKAESRLAEIQRGVEGLQGYDKARILVAYADVIALLQPQGQADTSGLPG